MPGRPKKSPTKKRSPGRPKKSLTKKRSPGRPKKSLTKKRSPGRPKKSLTKKRGPGRPKKSLTKKRGPGRPKKSPKGLPGPGRPRYPSGEDPEIARAKSKAKALRPFDFIHPPPTFLRLPNLPDALQIDGGNDKGRPRYPRTAVFVITKDPKTKKYEVLLCRKAMGPASGYKSEKDQVGYKSKTPGASGTDEKYWGTWGSFGGTNDKKAESNLRAGLIEVRDEGALTVDQTKEFRFLHSFVRNGTMIYIAYCPWSIMQTVEYRHMNVWRSSNRRKFDDARLDLLKKSHGEIAEIRLVPIDKISSLKNGLSSYTEKSFSEIVVPFLDTLG